MSGRRNLVWSRSRSIQRCERCREPLDLCQPDESRPNVLIGVCRDGCRGWYLMSFAPGDQPGSDRPLSCLPCPIDPPPPSPPVPAGAVSPPRLHRPRT